MAENVRQGFRAGGRAPRGYKLVSIDTGAVRDGLPVTKTKRETDDDAMRQRSLSTFACVQKDWAVAR